jgi:hypothetical protein
MISPALKVPKLVLRPKTVTCLSMTFVFVHHIRYFRFSVRGVDPLMDVTKARSYAYYKISYVKIRAYDSKNIIRMIRMLEL